MRSCARVLSLALAWARQGPALPIISGRRARIGPFCAVGVAEQKWGRPAGQRVPTVRTRIHCHEGERSAESGPRDGSWDEVSQSSTGAHQSSSSLFSRQCRQTDLRWDAGCTGTGRSRWKEVKRPAEARSRIFDGQSSPIAGGLLPWVRGSAQGLVCSLALGFSGCRTPARAAGASQLLPG